MCLIITNVRWESRVIVFFLILAFTNLDFFLLKMCQYASGYIVKCRKLSVVVFTIELSFYHKKFSLQKNTISPAYSKAIAVWKATAFYFDSTECSHVNPNYLFKETWLSQVVKLHTIFSLNTKFKGTFKSTMRVSLIYLHFIF